MHGGRLGRRRTPHFEVGWENEASIYRGEVEVGCDSLILTTYFSSVLRLTANWRVSS